MCRKVHKNLSDAIGPFAATYVPLAGCSVWNLFIYLSIYLYITAALRMFYMMYESMRLKAKRKATRTFAPASPPYTNLRIGVFRHLHSSGSGSFMGFCIW